MLHIVDGIVFETMAASFDGYKDTSGYVFKPFVHPKDCEGCSGKECEEEDEMHFYHPYEHVPRTRKWLEDIQFDSEREYEKRHNVPETQEVMQTPDMDSSDEDDIIIVKEMEKIEQDKPDGPLDAFKALMQGTKDKKEDKKAEKPKKKRMSLSVVTSKACRVTFKSDCKVTDLKIKTGEKKYPLKEQGVFYYIDDKGNYVYDLEFNN